MSAEIRTASPITALAGWPPGVRGRGSSMTMRPITTMVYPAFPPLSHLSAIRPHPLPFRSDEGTPQLHRPSTASRTAGAPPGPGHEPALVVGRADPGSVPLGRPRRLGDERPRPDRSAGAGAPPPAPVPGGRPGVPP